MKLFNVFAATLLTFGAVMAQADTVSLQTSEQAYYNGHAMALSNMVEGSTPQNQWVVRYRMGSLLLGKEDMARAKEHMHALMLDLEVALKAEPNNAEGWAILSSVYGMMTFLDPSMAMSYGPKAGFAEGRAADVDKNNPMALYLIGVNKFHTPEQWGGGMQTAFDYLTKAIANYETIGDQRAWGYVDALAWRSKAAKALGKTELAKQDLEKAAKLQPSFGLVVEALATM